MCETLLILGLMLVGIIILVHLYDKPCKKKPAPAPAPCNVQPLPCIDEEADWMTQCAKLSLAPQIYSQHAEFVSDMGHFGGMAALGYQQELSGDNDLVPWSGMRRPKYNVEVSPYARNVASYDPADYGKDHPSTALADYTNGWAS